LVLNVGLALPLRDDDLLEPETRHHRRLRRVSSSRHPYDIDIFSVAKRAAPTVTFSLATKLAAFVFYRIAMRPFRRRKL
jgi:hypothetical protein